MSVAVSTPTMSWKPVLEGPIADAALLAIHDVALAIAAEPAAADPADRTLFWAYATNVIDAPFAHTAYAAAFDDVIATLRDGVTTVSLHGGLAGLGFTLAHVLDGGAEEELEVIDEALLGVLAERWDGSLDLAQGVVGVGVYFVERLAKNPRAALAADGLDRIVRLLERTSIRTDAGATWLTTLDAMRGQYPDGFHDCGVAHGVPGMIGFLSRARRVQNSCRTRGLCDDAARWLRSQSATGFEGRFPTMVPPLSPAEFGRFARLGTDPGVKRRSRAAWCYGDPGVAAATWIACPDIARETALECSTRDASTCGVRDGSLCHGAAGLAHLANRFYQATGDETHADAARAWFARAIDVGVASHGLIEGSIGVALSLIAAITPEAPSWDRILLADCPERVS
jgi:lantibiotic biosynthesis protein